MASATTLRNLVRKGWSSTGRRTGWVLKEGLAKAFAFRHETDASGDEKGQAA